MNVAILVDGLAAEGAERQATLTAAAVACRGHTAHLVMCSPSQHHADLSRDSGVPVVHLNRGGPLRPARLMALARHLRQQRVDVAHVFSESANAPAWLAARLAGVPCIYVGRRRPVRSAWPFRWMSRVLGWGTAGWIVNSEYVKRTVMEDHVAPAHRVYVVPNAVHPITYESQLTREAARAAFGVRGEAIVVTMIAGLHRDQNHAMLLRVARRLADNGMNAVFLLAGAGPERTALERIIARMALESHVRLLGRVENTNDLLRATDVVTLTAVSEGLPSALLDAGAAGLPCISTENGGASEVILPGCTGYLVLINDDDAMVAHLTDLAGDTARRATMGAAAREHVRARFSPDALGDRIVAVYEAGLAAARQ